ncbi:MAG: penicillin-binding protein 2 [Phycisphaerae bacterium]
MTPPTRQRRVGLLLTVGLGALLLALAGYLVFIHVESAEALASRATRMHHMRYPVPATRGRILDARLRVLAGSQAGESVFADPRIVADPDEAARRVADVLGLDRDHVCRLLAEHPDRRFVWIRRRVPAATAEAVRELDLRGIALVTEGKRHYPNGSLAAHVLGFVGVDEQGLEGLEKVFDARLSGTPGEAYVLADLRRRPIWMRPGDFTPAEDGQSLVLTIDAVIQAAAEDALAQACEEFKAASGSVVVMDPRTGGVLAMANVPTFHPARYGAFPTDARRNRAVTDTFPPGSSGKPFVAARALEAGVVRFGEVFYCEDGYWPEARLRDAGHAYGNLTFEQGIIKSSNILLGKIGLRMGNARLHASLKAFGFGSRTGIWLPGEAPGLVFPLGRWTRLSTTRVPFGQEYAVTPLQMAVAFSAFASEGRILRPRILRGVLDGRGRVVARLTDPQSLGRPVRPATARRMIDRALVGVVEEGTGRRAQVPGYRVFGKTGTAQKVDPETGAISHSRYVAWFLAGAPADDPRIVIAVAVNEPDRSIAYYGGTVAAPVAQKILARALPYLGVEPSGEVPAEAAAGRTLLVDQPLTP